MNGSYLSERFLYYAAVICEEMKFTKPYKGICNATLKKGYAHCKTIYHWVLQNNTKLST